MTKSKIPFIPANADVAELTPRSVILGVILGIVLTSANAYLALLVGMSVSASIPAAVISMGVLRGLMKRGTILENNIVQTIASSGESMAAGIVFTVPALLIAGVWEDIEFWPTFIICISGGLLGICFMIPVRKIFIVDDKTLTYPEGLACAEVLKAGEVGGVSARWVLIAIILGAVQKLFTQVVNLFKESADWVWSTGKSVGFLGLQASPALLGVGYIVGLNVAIVAFIGSFIICNIAVPLYAMKVGVEGNAEAFFWGAWKQMRFIGVGTMVVGGLWSIVAIRKNLTRGVKEVIEGYRKRDSSRQAIRTDENMPGRQVAFLLALAVILVLGLYIHLTHSFMAGLVSTVAMVFMSFYFVAVCSYVVGLIGSSNTPISGFTVCTVLISGGLLWIFGITGARGIIATLGIAGVVCCAVASGADLSQDLKTGYIVGATPKHQQWMEIVGAIIPAFLMAPILTVLHHSYGIGTGQPGALNAPQATLFASLAKGMMGQGTLPWDYILIGVGIGVVVVIIDEILKARNAEFRMPVLAVAIGMYLPLMLMTTLVIGGAISAVVKDKRDAGVGVLFASGLVAGDAIMGVISGAIKYIGLKYYGADPIPFKLPPPIAETNLMTFAVTALLALVLWLVAKNKEKAGV